MAECIKLRFLIKLRVFYKVRVQSHNYENEISAFIYNDRDTKSKNQTGHKKAQQGQRNA
jgi:hypothetical protein